MLRYSSLGTSCILVVLTLLGTTFGDPQLSINDTKLMRAELLCSFAESKILLMGVLDHNLLIITKDSPSMVYEVPMTKYVNGQINLYGAVPSMELKEKWPALNSNDNFTRRVLSGQNGKSFPIAAHKEALVFALDSKANVLQTVTFTIKPPRASYQELEIDDSEFSLSKAHLISSDEPNVFFSLNAIFYGRIYVLNKHPFNNPSGIKPEQTQTCRMCKSPNANGSIGEILLNPVSSDCSSIEYIDWKIVNGGFVYQNHVHLFTKDQVYIFKYTGAFPSRVVLKVVNLTDFFIISTKKLEAVSIIVFVVGLVMFITFTVAILLILFSKSTAQNKRYKVSVSYKMGQNRTAALKESLNVSAATAESNNPTGTDTSANVSTGDDKLVNIVSSSTPAKQAKQPGKA